MSSFVVGKRVIDALVTVAFEGPANLRWDRFTNHIYITQDLQSPTLTETEIGRLLWLGNHKGVTDNYGDTDNFPGPKGLTLADIEAYQYKRQQRMTVPQALATISMFEYQACDSTDWETSPAHRFCEQLRSKLCRTLPGFDEPAWIWESED